MQHTVSDPVPDLEVEQTVEVRCCCGSTDHLSDMALTHSWYFHTDPDGYGPMPSGWRTHLLLTPVVLADLAVVVCQVL